MQRIPVSSLHAGQVFAESLFLVSDQMLLLSGTVLTQRHLDILRRDGAKEVVLAGSFDELGPLALTARRAHAERAASASRDHDNNMSWPTHPDLLRRGRALAAAVEGEAASLSLRVDPVDAAAPTGPAPDADALDWPDAAGHAAVRSEAVESLRRLLARVEAGVPTSATDFDPLLDDLMRRLAQYPQRFTQLALLIKGRDNYLPDHAYTTAVLAAAMAKALRWDIEDIRAVALAGLLADVGMLVVPHRIRVGGCALTEMDRGRVRKHAMAALAMLEPVADLPTLVKLAILQHHERENGSGYPRGKRKDAICDYARVLAVADTFAATMSPRSYRQPKLPYIAMKETLRLASTMHLWPPACRALVQLLGLFPVGSQVKLSTGQRASVLAANPRAVDRPLVQPLNEDDQPVGRPIDLSQTLNEKLMVVQACAPSIEAAGIRVPAA